MAKLCSVHIPEIKGLKGDELTVGREFYLNCQTEFPHQLDTENLSFVLAPDASYQIQLLNFELRSPLSADIKVTSYRTGEIQLKDLMLTDGSQQINLGELSFFVKSILPPPEAGAEEQQPQPYPPMGPVGISVPGIYWTVLGAVLILAFAQIVYSLIRWLQRKNLKERLKQHDAALSPLAQLHQNFRKLQRGNTVFFGGTSNKEHITEAVSESEKFLRLFLTRQYETPALEWSDRAILRDLKKYQKRAYQEYSQDLKALLDEYERAKKDFSKVTETDAVQIVKRTRELAEKMEAQR